VRSGEVLHVQCRPKRRTLDSVLEVPKPLTPALSPSDGAREKNVVTHVIYRRASPHSLQNEKSELTLWRGVARFRAPLRWDLCDIRFLFWWKISSAC
jgi:hypothetical protein